MSEIQASCMENLSDIPQVTSTPASQRSRRKRANRKKRCRSHTSVQDDSFDNFTPNAFWDNFQKAFQWGNNQEVAYWRSRAVALEAENTILRHQIMRLSLNDKDNVLPGVNTLPTEVQDTSFNFDQSSPHDNIYPKRTTKRGKRRSRKTVVTEEQMNDVNDSQLEFEVTEEMKDFFELHMRHKMEQEKKHLEDKKKSEEAAYAAGEENAKLIPQPINFSARAGDLKVLYGDASQRIHGMETAVQLTFRRRCERTGARLWPNIPLRL